MSKSLYRVSITSKEKWRDKKKPIYVVAGSNSEAKAYATKHIKSPYEAGITVRLGAQVCWPYVQWQ